MNFGRVKQNGFNCRHDETCSLVGVQSNPNIKRILTEIGNSLQELADEVQGRGAQRHDAVSNVEKTDLDKEIDRLVCTDCYRVPMQTKRTSSYKNLLTTFVRLFVGEILAATLKQVDAGYVGCNDELFAEGLKVLSRRDPLVSTSKAAASASRGASKKTKRINSLDVLRSILTMTCKKAPGWQCKAAWTSFVCTLLFSILQAELDYGCVDKWKLSQASMGKQKKSPREGGPDAQGPVDEEEGGTEVEEGEEEPDEGQSIDPKTGIWPGDKAVFKDASEKYCQAMLKKCLKIMAEGGFWLLQHAHAEFADNQLRGSNERRGSMLSSQVFEFVVKAHLPSGQGVPHYRNWWTHSDNSSIVKAFFSDPKGQPEIGCRWIPVDAQFAGQAVGFTIGNILKDLRGSAGFAAGSEAYNSLFEKAMNVVAFVVSLPAPLDATSTSATQLVNTHDAHVAPRKNRAKKDKANKPLSPGSASQSDVTKAAQGASLTKAQQHSTITMTEGAARPIEREQAPLEAMSSSPTQLGNDNSEQANLRGARNIS